MQKPAGYDQAEAFTGFKVIPPGGHICKILKAEVTSTQTGREKMILFFDIAEGDYAGYYLEQYNRKKSNNPESNWQGTFHQLTEDNSLPYFKGMIESIEKSNPGFEFNWDERTLVGKLFGGVFGQEEYESRDGEIKLSTKLRFIRTVDDVRKGVEIPKIKTVNGEYREPAPRSFGGQVFPEAEIPF